MKLSLNKKKLAIKAKKEASVSDLPKWPGPKSETGYDGNGNSYQCVGNISKFASLDIGLDGTGYAVWDRSTFLELQPPLYSGVITDVGVSPGAPWWVRAETIRQTLFNELQRHGAICVYAEQPQFMEGGKGITSARKGDLIKLTTVFGMCATCAQLFVPVPVSEWKGQLSKKITDERIMKKLGKFGWKPTTKTSHEMDAVGVGLFVKGYF